MSEDKVTKIYLSREEVLKNFFEDVMKECPDLEPVVLLGKVDSGYVIHHMHMERPTIAFAQKTLNMFFDNKWWGEQL